MTKKNQNLSRSFSPWPAPWGWPRRRWAPPSPAAGRASRASTRRSGTWTWSPWNSAQKAKHTSNSHKKRPLSSGPSLLFPITWTEPVLVFVTIIRPGEQRPEDVLLLGGGDANGVRDDLGRLLLGHLQHGPDGDLQLEKNARQKYPQLKFL